MQQKSDSATIRRDTFETMLSTLVEQAEQIRELRATVGLQARQIEHLRHRLRQVEIFGGPAQGDKGYPTA
jgi:flagellin-like hook-associated protein FlgL